MSTLDKNDIKWCQNIYRRHKKLWPEGVDPIYEIAYSSTYDHTRSDCSNPERLTAVLCPNHQYYGNWAFFKGGFYLCSLSVDILEGDTPALAPA